MAISARKKVKLDGGAAPSPDLSELSFGPKFRGGLDGIRDGHIVGWIIDLERRDAPTDVNLIVEGVAFGTRSTFIRRLDIEPFVGDNTAGFDIELWSFRRSLLIASIRKLQGMSDAQLDGPCDVRLVVDEGPVAIEAGHFGISRRNLLEELTNFAPSGVTLPTRQGLDDSVAAPAEDATGQQPLVLSPQNASAGATEAALMRASRRVQSLASQVKKYEREVPQLSERVGRLQKRVDALEMERWELGQWNQTLQVQQRVLTAKVQNLERQKSSLLIQAADLRLSLLKIVGCLGSHIEGFDRYSKQVEYDPRRLFTFALEAELRESRLVSAETKQHARAIRDLFDPLYYIVTYPDILSKGLNPLLHYVSYGFKEGRSPNALFDLVYYKMQAGAVEGDPLLHFVQAGATRGLNPHPLFNCRFYEEQNPDVAATGLNPLFHYQTVGAVERRNPSICFDTAYFLSKLPAAEAIENPLEHYLTHWKSDGVDPHPLFSAAYFGKMAGIEDFQEAPLVLYARSWELQRRGDPHPMFSLRYLREIGVIEPDQTASPLEQYLTACQDTDISPHPVFDADLYRYQIEVERNGECILPSAADYLTSGYLDDTLLPSLFFDPAVYRTRNELQIMEPPLVHYIEEGDRQGLICHQIFDAGYYNAQRTDKLPITALEHMARYPDAALVPDSRVGRPIDPDIVNFVRVAVSGDGEFDAAFYKSANYDLRDMTDAQAYEHFVNWGRSEGRMASPRGLLGGSGTTIRDIPVGMSSDEYCDLSVDLAELRGQALRCITHYFCYGRAENRLVGKWQLKLDGLALDIPTHTSPLRTDDTDLERKEVCILTHIFYPDLWPELAGFARNFDVVTRDVFINVVDLAWTPEFHLQLRRLCPGAFVQLSNDDGRDIGGFIRLLDNVDIDRYEVFAFMHSKKSPHIPIERGNHWRQSMLSAFAGSPEIVRQCMEMFHDDPTIGIIGAEAWRSQTMGNNYEQYERLLDLLGIEGDNRACDYLSGTMFLVRQPIIKRLHNELRKLDWEYGGDKDVEFHRDGQVAHGVERVIPALARHLGFQVVWN